jgi:uncharacterized glyoxalase superfamily protein PhnB
MYTVFVTRDIEASKAFYVKWFHYSIVFESSWFILLSSPGDQPAMIAFIHEVHPSSPPSPKPFSGDGAFLTLDVKDADAVYHQLKEAGAIFKYDLKQEPWGQLRFALTDPNGLWIDVVEQTDPHPGWWDQYLSD